MGTFIFWVIVVLFTPAILFVVFKLNQGKAQKKNIESFMAKNDFVPEYLNPYNLAIDTKTRRVVFATDTNKHAIYHTSDIINIEQDTRKGAAAPIIQIIFTVNNLDEPRIFIPFRSLAERNKWFDRIMIAAGMNRYS